MKVILYCPRPVASRAEPDSTAHDGAGGLAEPPLDERQPVTLAGGCSEPLVGRKAPASAVNSLWEKRTPVEIAAEAFASYS